MIVQTTVNGRKATVAYITKDFEPATKEAADLAKVIFEDGEVVFLNMKEPVK
jgi:hypothetical protein